MNCIKEQRAVILPLFFRHKVWLKTSVNFYQTTGSHVQEAVNFWKGTTEEIYILKILNFDVLHTNDINVITSVRKSISTF